MTGIPAALVSIHDVAPAVLDKVDAIITSLLACALTPFTLLVVPGKPWSAAAIERLRQWQRHGAELAGHGWSHRAGRPRSCRHALHSLVLSRDAGEHYSHPSVAGVARVERCHAWFAGNGLPAPTLYVPPAWTLGTLHPGQLRDTGFDTIELLDGLYQLKTGERCRLPLMGFEADTRIRRRFLQGFNALNGGIAKAVNRPLRIAIHPHDPDLLMGEALARTLDRIGTCRSYRDP